MGIQTGTTDEGASAEIGLEAARRAARTQRAGGVDADVSDLAGPPVCAANLPVVDEDAGTDPHLTGDVDERARTGGHTGLRGVDGEGRQIGLVGDDVHIEVANGIEQLGQWYVAPSEVRGKCERVSRDETGKGQPGSHVVMGSREVGPGLLEGCSCEFSQSTHRGGRIGIGEVIDAHVLGEDRACQIDDACPQIADVCLEPEGQEMPWSGDQGHGRASAPGREGFKLVHQSDVDELVDQAGGGRPGDVRAMGNLGACGGTGAVEDVTQDEGEICGSEALGAHTRPCLPDEAMGLCRARTGVSHGLTIRDALSSFVPQQSTQRREQESAMTGDGHGAGMGPSTCVVARSTSDASCRTHWSSRGDLRGNRFSNGRSFGDGHTSLRGPAPRPRRPGVTCAGKSSPSNAGKAKELDQCATH